MTPVCVEVRTCCLPCAGVPQEWTSPRELLAEVPLRTRTSTPQSLSETALIRYYSGTGKAAWVLESISQRSLDIARTREHLRARALTTEAGSTRKKKSL